tara:strand:- start:454 stop:573 length:120 start_codon:yes stop_codon:yes gene_type:complete
VVVEQVDLMVVIGVELEVVVEVDIENLQEQLQVLIQFHL